MSNSNKHKFLFGSSKNFNGDHKRKIFYKTSLIFFFLIVTIITQTSCTGKVEPVERTGYYLDTICKITVYDMKDMSEDRASKVIEEAFSLCADYENMISKTKENSDIYKVNHSRGNWVDANPETVKLLKKSIEYGNLSDGRFDVTVGKVTDLWDFHSENPKLPDQNKLKDALRHVDYRNIIIEGNRIRLSDAEGEIDLGGIGKGFIGDRLSDFLKKKGVKSAIISLGGNLMIIGDKGGEPFGIGIEKPYSDQSEIVGSTSAKNCSIVTSGIYERYFSLRGKKYHHIMDVKTGYPVETDVVGVTIKGPLGKSADCDALSTICLIVGVEKGKELIERIDGFEAAFIDKNGKITKTKGMDFENI